MALRAFGIFFSWPYSTTYLLDLGHLNFTEQPVQITEKSRTINLKSVLVINLGRRSIALFSVASARSEELVGSCS